MAGFDAAGVTRPQKAAISITILISAYLLLFLLRYKTTPAMIHERARSIDTSKGIVVILIIFLNFVLINNLPLWPAQDIKTGSLHIAAGLLFPAFIFLYSMIIPFFIGWKINDGNTGYDITRSVFTRSLILVLVGILLGNTMRVDASLTGFSGYLWSSLAVVAIFIVWNRYPEKGDNIYTTSSLRLFGLAILVFLVFKFQSGSYENNGSLIPGWWELPGLAGWSWLVASFSYMVFRNSLAGNGLILITFLSLNILGYNGRTDFLLAVRPYLGVITDGYIPVIALSGMMTGIIIRKYGSEKKTLWVLMILGLAVLTTGIMAYIFVYSRGVYGNPAWAVTAAGAALLLFTIIHLLDRKLESVHHLNIVMDAGRNMIAAYIIPFFFLNIAGLAGLNIHFFLIYDNLLLSVIFGVVWVILILLTLRLLLRLNIRLKF